ncbi:MAG TPA: cob(I)yrinic acid a,c-diamide adenosyltransferase [Nocardioidaceae bacterium]|nr:cob(I)yrinic acid a,c-diamide adenosyltransferase [Nocardioidaceae bacterium]
MSELRNRETAADPRYTRESDLGRTLFGDIGEVAKYDIRLGAFADCEEANAAVGFALSMGGYDVRTAATLTSVQNDLFDLAADLSAPTDQDLDPPPVRIVDAHVTWVERAYEHYSADLAQVRGFVLPGGTVAAALLFQARIAIRRAERTTWAALEQHPQSINPLTAHYLNRVSALLFVLARTSNADLGDRMWHPMASIAGPTLDEGVGGE